MDLNKNGRLIYELRKANNMTQKQLADKLGVVPKTVSKWETGEGFPDVSTVTHLAEVLGVSEKTLLTGTLNQNPADNGNMKRTKFYVCPHCMSMVQTSGCSGVVCCGKETEALKPMPCDDDHMVKISDIDDEYFIEFDHAMTKDHYISFVSYVRFDRVLTIRLYPEQNAQVHMPKMRGGKLYFYCSKHGLYEYK